MPNYFYGCVHHRTVDKGFQNKNANSQQQKSYCEHHKEHVNGANLWLRVA